MSIIDAIKPFWPLLFTVFLPRGLAYYNALKTAYRTRPPARPLPTGVSRSLNIVFCSIVFFFIQSFPRGLGRYTQNVFATTNTRLGVPTDVLFTRLALMKPNGVLSANEEVLRNVLATKESRLIYLTHGPQTLLTCPTCHPSLPHTYTLHSLPTTILLPHLLHLFVLGLATSTPLTSPHSSRFRNPFVIAALLLALLDITFITAYDPYPTLIRPDVPGPVSLYALLRVLRSLSICVLDAALAFYMWARSTRRFLFLPLLADPNLDAVGDISELQTQAVELVRGTAVVLQTGLGRLRGTGVVRSAVVRDGGLKGVENGYWAEVRRREGVDGGEGDDGIYEDEEVQAVIARVYEGGGVDVPRVRREAGAFVDQVTRGLKGNA